MLLDKKKQDSLYAILNKIATLISVQVMIIGTITLIFVIIFRTFVLEFTLLEATVLSSCIAYVISSKAFLDKGPIRVLISIFIVLSGLMLFEIIFYTGLGQLTLFSILANLSPDGSYSPFWAFVLFLFPFLYLNRMKVGRKFIVALIVCMVSWEFWFGLGFPQAFNGIYPLPQNAQTIPSFILESLCKLTTVPLPAILFMEKK